MSIHKTLQQKRHAEARVFLRLHMAEAIARGASHIRSKRAAALQAGVDEVRREYAADFGEESVAAFLECIESWLNDRGNTVAATALRFYLETAVPDDGRISHLAERGDFDFPEHADMMERESGIALPVLAPTVSMYTTDGFAQPDAGNARHLDGVRSARPRSDTSGEARVHTAAVASRAGLRFADGGQAAHSHRFSRSR